MGAILFAPNSKYSAKIVHYSLLTHVVIVMTVGETVQAIAGLF